MKQFIANVVDSLALRWQLHSRPPKLDLEPDDDPAIRLRSEAVTRWALEYLSLPHPMLRRGGAVCPFVRPSIELGRFIVSWRDEVTTGNLRKLRALVLGAARTFLDRYPRQAPKSTFTSVVLVFRRLPESQCGALDTLHDQLKTHMVTELGLMFTPFHPLSAKPSATNPDFAVFRGPFPLLALRHIDVRDIRFLDHNRRGFLSYHERFAAAYARGDVSDEFGDVTRFKAACVRFGAATVGNAVPQPN